MLKDVPFQPLIHLASGKPCARLAQCLLQIVEYYCLHPKVIKTTRLLRVPAVNSMSGSNGAAWLSLEVLHALLTAAFPLQPTALTLCT